MRGPSALPRALLLGGAALFAAVIVSYGAGWMVYVGKDPAAFLGIEFETSPGLRLLRLTRIEAGSAAVRAGLRPGNRITHVNGASLESLNPFHDAVARGRPGDAVALTVERPGAGGALTRLAVLDPYPAGAMAPRCGRRRRRRCRSGSASGRSSASCPCGPDRGCRSASRGASTGRSSAARTTRGRSSRTSSSAAAPRRRATSWHRCSRTTSIGRCAPRRWPSMSAPAKA